MVWGKLPVDYRVPPALNFPAFTVFCDQLPGVQDVRLADFHRHLRDADAWW